MRKSYLYWATVGLLCLCLSGVPAFATGTSAQYTKQLPPLAPDRPQTTQPSPAIPVSPQPQVPLTNEKVAWYKTVSFQFSLAAVCTVLFLSACWIFLGDWVKKRFGKSPIYSKEQLAERAWILGDWASALNLIFLIGLPLTVWGGGTVEIGVRRTTRDRGFIVPASDRDCLKLLPCRGLPFSISEINLNRQLRDCTIV